MSKTLVDAITEIQRLVATVDGIRVTPTYPPDQMNQFPFAICYPDSAAITKEGAGAIRGLHTIALEIHIPNKDKARNIATLIPIGAAVYRLLFQDTNATLASTVDTIIAINYDFGPLGYESVDTIGWRFGIDIKLREVL